MAENGKLNQVNWPNIFKISLILISIFIIALLCPKQRVFDFQFAQDQYWQYDDLSAHQDIPLLKFESEIEEERQAVRDAFLPYFYYDNSIKELAISGFKAEFDARIKALGDSNQFAHLRKNPKLYESYSIEWIDKIYNRGIISDTLDPTKKVFNLIQGIRSSQQLASDYNSVSYYKELIRDTLKYAELVDSDFLLPLLPEFIFQNVSYSDSLTNKYLLADLDAILVAKGVIKQGAPIVNSGDYIGPSSYRRLYSYKSFQADSSSNSKSYWLVFSGYFLLLTLLMTIFWLNLLNTMPAILKETRHLLFMLLLIVGYSYLTFAVESIEGLSSYIIPFAIVPMVVRIFYSDRLALFVHLIVVIVASLISNEGYQFTVIQLIVGISAILSKPNARNWNAFFKSIIWIFVSYVLAFFGTSLLQGVIFDAVYFQFFIWLALNALLCLLAFPLIPLLERLFGFTSDFTLVELSDLNHPLLKEMAEHASGTLQHSLQVSNLAEAAAEKTNANGLLVKVGALYHDIGKLKNPQMFIENQKSDNPHNDLAPTDSAKIIIDHVLNGIEVAQEHKLPKPLVEFIRTHHGTTRTEYFYKTAIQQDSEGSVNEADFVYPGPLPYSKEQSILMLADSLEAASKSLKSPNAEDIDNLVDKIVDSKIASGQLNDSPLTFKELEICKNVFKLRLKSMNHVRIEYPE
jgi:putative nucleotidyltransferase with HDIG domain